MSCNSHAAATVAQKTAGTLGISADEADKLVVDLLAQGGMLALIAAACAGAAFVSLLACFFVLRAEPKTLWLQTILLEAASAIALVLYIALLFMLV